MPLPSRWRGGPRLRRPTGSGQVDVVVSVVVSAAQTEIRAVWRRRQGHAASAMRPGNTFMMCSTVDPNWSMGAGSAPGRPGPPVWTARSPGGAAKAASGQMTMMTSATPAAYAAAGDVLDGHGRQGLPPGRQGLAWAARSRSSTSCWPACTSPRPPKPWPWACVKAWRPPPLYEVITHSAGNSWMFENRMAHMLAGDYTPLLGRGHLRQGPGPGAGHRTRQQIPAAAGQPPRTRCSCRPPLPGLPSEDDQRGDQDFPWHYSRLPRPKPRRIAHEPT